jgi:hypothetical protein
VLKKRVREWYDQQHHQRPFMYQCRNWWIRQYTTNINDGGDSMEITLVEHLEMTDMTATNTGPITQAEMIELFGEAMPPVAVSLVFDGDMSLTIGEVRQRLRDLALRRKADAAIFLDACVKEGMQLESYAVQAACRAFARWQRER